MCRPSAYVPRNCPIAPVASVSAECTFRREPSPLLKATTLVLPRQRGARGARTGDMSIGEPICAFYGFIKAERPRIFAEVTQREGLNTELFDFADELVVRGPSGEVERFVDALRKAIMMRMGEINAMHERDLLTHRTWKAEWEARWTVKIVLNEPRDMERVEVFVRDLFRENALADAFTEEEMREMHDEFLMMGKRLESKLRWNAWKRTQQEGAGEAGESEEPISTARSASRFLDSPRDAKVAERVPEATPPPVAAPDAMDATESSFQTECPPPAEGIPSEMSFPSRPSRPARRPAAASPPERARQPSRLAASPRTAMRISPSKSALRFRRLRPLLLAECASTRSTAVWILGAYPSSGIRRAFRAFPLR